MVLATRCAPCRDGAHDRCVRCRPPPPPDTTGGFMCVCVCRRGEERQPDPRLLTLYDAALEGAPASLKDRGAALRGRLAEALNADEIFLLGDLLAGEAERRLHQAPRAKSLDFEGLLSRLEEVRFLIRHLEEIGPRQSEAIARCNRAVNNAEELRMPFPPEDLAISPLTMSRLCYRLPTQACGQAMAFGLICWEGRRLLCGACDASSCLSPDHFAAVFAVTDDRGCRTSTCVSCRETLCGACASAACPVCGAALQAETWRDALGALAALEVRPSRKAGARLLNA